LIAVVDCSIGESRAIGILKLEKEEGVRLRETTHHGLRTFDVSYIRDLILTRKTKLFKIGFFFPPPDSPSDDPEGRVCDEQRGYLPRTEVAGFFLETFLGCRLVDDPRIATKQFFLAAQDFINEHIEDPVERTEILNHLLSEVTNRRTRINVLDFARASLSAQKRQPFLSYLAEHGVDGQTIAKDITLIEAQTKKMAMEFYNGISVVGSVEAFGESVKVDRARGGDAKVQITGKLKRVKGK
jgi:hypothetical protein